MQKWWKYALCTAALTFAYGYAITQYLNYRASKMEPLDVGGFGLAILMYQGLYVLIGIIFLIIGAIVFAKKKQKRDRAEEQAILERLEQADNETVQ
ncbi:hypothetical protein [Butyrivibrio sp. INlla16]|uniref:hypothetical protein n=1 Tax=Butyrivibrio sp. INlla16 TaxID=1520807 RepID=UPI001113C8DD|nr:hypothetical protein [Butyrivibrio sp. INlla16]